MTLSINIEFATTVNYTSKPIKLIESINLYKDVCNVAPENNPCTDFDECRIFL